MDKTVSDKERAHAGREYPGVAVDRADDNKVTEKEVDARTKLQNNNPRNNDDAMPTRQ